MNTTQIILQFGGFGVIAIMFALVLRWLLHTIDAATERAVTIADQTAKTTAEFTSTANTFAACVQNHMVHEQEAFDKLTAAIERLCTMWDNGKH